MGRSSTKALPEKASAEAVAPELAASLLAWYDRHRRKLPWRALPGEQSAPYTVWLSEIMLQQTTVTAVKPYFEAFLAHFPNVEALAAAPVETVMKQWAGLGYYSRARNLHACAKAVVTDHAGQFPQTEAALRLLPGIGAYTAAAIAAIAFGEPAAVVDGNVERVVTRLYAIETQMPAAKTEIRARTALLVPAGRPGDFAQAMMDLGATICTPRQPVCSLCPLWGSCRAAALGRPEDFPRKAPKLERPQRGGAVFILRRPDGALLVRTRPPRGLLGGMTEFPGTVWTDDFDVAKALHAAPMIADYRKLTARVRHVFTHFALTLDVFVADVAQQASPPAGCRFVDAAELDGEAFPSLMRKVMTAVGESVT